MMKGFLLVGLFSTIFAWGQPVESEFETKGLIKVSLYPAVWTAFRGNLRLIMYYESELRNRTSYNLVLDYSAFPFKPFNSMQAVYINKSFYFRPQIRHYFGHQIYRGYHFGIFPLYNYRANGLENKKANYLGGGIITGYQFFVRKRFPIEINVWYALHHGRYKKIDSSSQTLETGWESFDQLVFELNLEWPIVRKRKD